MKEKKKIQLASTDTCTGCGACVQSCAKGAISMVEDREGFLQPHIDEKLCVGCRKCEQVCPVISPISIPQYFETKAYAAINTDEDIRMQSSSGGVFYELAKWTIEQGGVVFGARWDEKWEVMHDYAENLEGVKAFMRSKYVQSRVEETYKQAKRFLDEDRWVLYSGTPCQMAGLHAFLGKDYDKLIMVDLICHGVPSPGVWRKYLKEATKGDKILNINFRDKTEGWCTHQCMVTTTSTTTRREQQMANPYFRGFLRNVYLRKSCYHCVFRTYHRISDLTIADYWGVEKLCPEMHDDKGTSVVLVHSEKGAQLIKNIGNGLRVKLEQKEDVIKCNASLNRENPTTTKRKRYFMLYPYMSFSCLVKVIDKDTILTRVQRKISKIINKWK